MLSREPTFFLDSPLSDVSDVSAQCWSGARTEEDAVGLEGGWLSHISWSSFVSSSAEPISCHAPTDNHSSGTAARLPWRVGSRRRVDRQSDSAPNELDLLQRQASGTPSAHVATK